LPISIELSEENPWWEDSTKINSDQKIVEWNESTIKWDPRIRHTFELKNDLVYSLRGPRQTGKTTTIKLIIKDLLGEGISPWNIMYYACDVESGPKELVTLIKNYFDNTKNQRKGKRCYLILDEISSIKNWQKGIKRLWDQGRLKNCTVIATGSHTMDLKRSAERLPGRRGDHTDVLDKIMLPMKFSEFVSVMDADLKKVIDVNFLSKANRMSAFDQLLHNKLPDALQNVYAYLPELDRCLQDYMLTGGVPKAINQYMDVKTISERTYVDQLDAILGDLGILNKSDSTFKQIAGGIIKSIGQTSSWRSFKKGTDIATENTVSQYVTTLEEMFVISILYQYDSEKKVATYRKEKKIHFQDPFYFNVLNSWISKTEFFDTSRKFVEKVENQGKLVEGIVADHMSRLAFMRSRNKHTFDHSDYIYYWKYNGNEVDLIYNDGLGIEIPIEVKFQNNISKRDLDGIINFKKHTHAKNALLLTRGEFSVERECIMVPVAMFLLMI